MIKTYVYGRTLAMPARRFIQCDVFSPLPTQGNGLAVIVDAEGLSDDQMQRFAAWTNLAETTFLLPPTVPDADYKVRILTPVREMLFAGHPTLGSCAAWLHTGGVPKDAQVVRQECGVGIVEIDISQQPPAFVAPPTTVEPMSPQQLAAIVEVLHIPMSSVLHNAQLNNGPVWQVLHLATAADVLAVDSSCVRWPVFKSIGLIGAHEPRAECDYEVRMLAPSSGMSEDPITGSLNAALAHWMQAHGRLTSQITIAQGTNIFRHGRVSVRTDNVDGRIFIGGETHILIEGTVTL